MTTRGPLAFCTLLIGCAFATAGPVEVEYESWLAGVDRIRSSDRLSTEKYEELRVLAERSRVVHTMKVRDIVPTEDGGLVVALVHGRDWTRDGRLPHRTLRVSAAESAVVREWKRWDQIRLAIDLEVASADVVRETARPLPSLKECRTAGAGPSFAHVPEVDHAVWRARYNTLVAARAWEGAWEEIEALGGKFLTWEAEIAGVERRGGGPYDSSTTYDVRFASGEWSGVAVVRDLEVGEMLKPGLRATVGLQVTSPTSRFDLERAGGVFSGDLKLIRLDVAVSEETAANDAENPFRGWTPEEVEKHRRWAKPRARRPAFEQMSGLFELVTPCGRCRGDGIVSGQRRCGVCSLRVQECFHCGGDGWVPYREPCETCFRTGAIVSRSKFKTAFLEFDTRRNDPEFKRKMERVFGEWCRNPKLARVHAIGRGYRIESVEVLGTHARVTTSRKGRSGRFEVTEEWIFNEDTWCLAGPHDAARTKWSYPSPGALPAMPTMPPEDRKGPTAKILRAVSPIAIEVEHPGGDREIVELAGVIRPDDREDLDERTRLMALERVLEYLNELRGKAVYLTEPNGLESSAASRIVRLVYFAETGVMLQFEAVDRGLLPARRGDEWELREHFERYEERARSERRGFWRFGPAEDD